MKVPKVLVGLGTVSSIEVFDKEGQLEKYSFPQKTPFVLTSNSTGTALFIFPGIKKKSIGATADQLARQISKASKLYEKWADFETDTAAAHNITEKRLSSAGNAYSITYKSDKWTGKKTAYIHHFTSENVKVLMDNKDKPSMIQIYGGRLKVKAEGIVG